MKLTCGKYIGLQHQASMKSNCFGPFHINRQLDMMKLTGGFQNTPKNQLSSIEIFKCPFSQDIMKTLQILILKRQHQVCNVEN
jgi:hypothetical protein